MHTQKLVYSRIDHTRKFGTRSADVDVHPTLSRVPNPELGPAFLFVLAGTIVVVGLSLGIRLSAA